MPAAAEKQRDDTDRSHTLRGQTTGDIARRGRQEFRISDLDRQRGRRRAHSLGNPQ